MKRLSLFLFTLLVLATGISRGDDRYHVTLHTTEGDVVVALYNETPIHRDNFLQKIREGVYENRPFNRIVHDFVIQSGEEQDTSIIAPEIIYPRYFHKRGALCMGRCGADPNHEFRSADEQIYFAWGDYGSESYLHAIDSLMPGRSIGHWNMDPAVYEYYRHNPGQASLDGRYTVFGEVIEGLDVLSDINGLGSSDARHPHVPYILHTEIKEPDPHRDYVIVVHGGAGDIAKYENDPEKANQYYAALDSALAIGQQVLEKGGKGLEAVQQVISYFESNPLFNAGKGATVTANGTFELDASIMEGKELTAGAVAGVKHVKHPILAANAVRTSSPHVMLTSDGADAFAKEQGLETVADNMYFATPRTMEWVKKMKAESKKNGTVGCVVLDQDGNLAAGTSTGGMLGKRWGRVGDSPVIGAGTYADNQGCAVSCTGHGEYFIRHCVAHSMSDRVKLLNQPLDEAARHILFDELNAAAGEGGLIAVAPDGTFTLQFNSTGMFRGYLFKENGAVKSAVGIGKDMKSK